MLPNGKIKWQGAEEEFGTPSAWATHCKRLVNPIKRSGCGWASVSWFLCVSLLYPPSPLPPSALPSYQGVVVKVEVVCMFVSPYAGHRETLLNICLYLSCYCYSFLFCGLPSLATFHGLACSLMGALLTVKARCLQRYITNFQTCFCLNFAVNKSDLGL